MNESKIAQSNLSQRHLPQSNDYKNWLLEVKQSFAKAQIKAAVKVNSTLLEFYWQLGSEIVEKQQTSQWGSGFLKQLSQDLSAEFSGVKGFSLNNLQYIKRWFLFYNQGGNSNSPNCGTSCSTIGQHLITQIIQIPWGHNLKIISKCTGQDEALFYVKNTITHGWSRNVLVHQIESCLYQREGKAVTNFEKTLPKAQSDLALQTLKDPYLFDFLTLTKDHNERELEQALVSHITDFLVELGAGFAYVGKQVHLDVGDQDFYLDLLFYHLKLRCYVVVELKTGDFKPEYAGKLSFYLTAVDKQLKAEQDNPTIGLLLCKNRNKIIAEYALSDNSKPIGVSEYQLSQALPDNFKSSLPSIKEIELELAGELGGEV